VLDIRLKAGLHVAALSIICLFLWLISSAVIALLVFSLVKSWFTHRCFKHHLSVFMAYQQRCCRTTSILFSAFSLSI